MPTLLKVNTKVLKDKEGKYCTLGSLCLHFITQKMQMLLLTH